MFPIALALVDTPDLTAVDESRMMAVVRRLSDFPTRNTLSPGLRDACDWAAGELRAMPRMQVELMTYTLPAGRRVPEAREVVQVVATLPGRTDRRIVVGAHIDSLNLEGPPDTARAPGANDDASGCAVVLELARLMSLHEWENTIVFALFSGEEQGLHGARALAARAKTEGWPLEAMLNNDTVGTSANEEGQVDRGRVRLFSDEADTHQSRELARFIAWTAECDVPGFGVKLVFRRDRFGRGGDHTPFAEAGFNAVRFIEVFEKYGVQHTADDLPEHVDAEYMANVARVNLAALRSLASAAPAPSEVQIARDQASSTTLRWIGTPGAAHVVYWRETTSPTWQAWREVPAGEATATIGLVNKDDHVFAVGTVGGLPVEAR